MVKCIFITGGSLESTFLACIGIVGDIEAVIGEIGTVFDSEGLQLQSAATSSAVG